MNSFRQLFNLYFDAGLPLLPDDNYVFTDWQHIYDFLEVTDRVKSTPAQAG